MEVMEVMERKEVNEKTTLAGCSKAEVCLGPPCRKGFAGWTAFLCAKCKSLMVFPEFGTGVNSD
jgi:hypothetical protein